MRVLVGIASVTLDHHIASFVAEVVRKCGERVPAIEPVESKSSSHSAEFSARFSPDPCPV